LLRLQARVEDPTNAKSIVVEVAKVSVALTELAKAARGF